MIFFLCIRILYIAVNECKLTINMTLINQQNGIDHKWIQFSKMQINSAVTNKNRKKNGNGQDRQYTGHYHM